jgi:hypothetical protein
MIQVWSNPVPYDTTRSLRRVTVPKASTETVPDTPGTYVIYRVAQGSTCDIIIDIGETGLRPNSKPHGLRGRLATTVDHSASEEIACDIKGGKVVGDLRVVWTEMESKEAAKELQDGLITLFRRECGRQPEYNAKYEEHLRPEVFESVYDDLKRRIGCSTAV